MFEIKEIENYNELIDFHLKVKSPYIVQTEYEKYLVSLCHDEDSYGNKLFKKLSLLGAYFKNELIGFIQYGTTNIGFDENGNINPKVNYQVIRNLYFEDGKVGEELLETAIKELKNDVFAFFHYFGMSCFSRHGKLFSNLKHIEELLFKYSFQVNETNVYYSTNLVNEERKTIEIELDEINSSSVQHIIFKDQNEFVGECEIHFVNKEMAYLRWIYVSDNKRHLGYGSKCMNSLKKYLYELGLSRLDTDTAEDNLNAQKYYERNGFVNLGKTKSYFKK